MAIDNITTVDERYQGIIIVDRGIRSTNYIAIYYPASKFSRIKFELEVKEGVTSSGDIIFGNKWFKRTFDWETISSKGKKMRDAYAKNYC